MTLDAYICNVEDSISECLEKILTNRERILFVCDTGGTLAGSLTQGDLVRALQKGVSAPHSVAGQWMNRHCFFVRTSDPRPSSVDVFTKFGHLAYPIVDDAMKVKEVLTLRDSLITDVHRW